MLKNRESLTCDYCNKKYANKKEMIAHHFFHEDQDLDNLLCSLNELDDNYYLPTASKVAAKAVSERVAEMDEELLADGSPKSRRMSDRIDEVVSLSKKYPIPKSSYKIEEESSPSDDVENDSDKKMSETDTNPNFSISQKSSGDNFITKQVNHARDATFSHPLNKLDSKIGIAVFDQDFTPKSHYFEQTRPPISKGSVFRSVENSDLAKVTASDHAYSKLTENNVAKSSFNGNSSFLRLVENTMMAKDLLSCNYIPTDSSDLVNDSKAVDDPRFLFKSGLTKDPTEFGNLASNELVSENAYQHINSAYDSESSVDLLDRWEVFF